MHEYIFVCHLFKVDFGVMLGLNGPRLKNHRVLDGTAGNHLFPIIKLTSTGLGGCVWSQVSCWAPFCCLLSRLQFCCQFHQRSPLGHTQTSSSQWSKAPTLPVCSNLPVWRGSASRTAYCMATVSRGHWSFWWYAGRSLFVVWRLTDYIAP